MVLAYAAHTLPNEPLDELLVLPELLVVEVHAQPPGPNDRRSLGPATAGTIEGERTRSKVIGEPRGATSSARRGGAARAVAHFRGSSRRKRRSG
jgi:hypothetical protein